MTTGPNSPPPGKATLWDTVKAVCWSFFGVRKSSEYEKDVSQLNPVHVIIAGVVAALIFIGVLIAIVKWVVSSGAANL